jgi:hypothetical protein
MRSPQLWTLKIAREFNVPNSKRGKGIEMINKVEEMQRYQHSFALIAFVQMAVGWRLE